MKSKLKRKAGAGKITEVKSGKPSGKSAMHKVSKTHNPPDLGLEEWQQLMRRQFGQQQNFLLKNTGENPVFPEFSLTNSLTGKTYRIAIRGHAPGDNYCSCPDYLLDKYGKEWRANTFYEDCFLGASPALLPQVQPVGSYYSPEQVLRNSYSLRCLEHFAEFLGLAEIERDPGKRFFENFRLRKLPLLDHVVQFQLR